MPPSPALRIRELDALRGLAALAVVAFHYTTRYDELFGRAAEVSWHAPWGAAGVELFFMLSGFVIFMTLDRTKGALDFAIGRFARLYPAYWAALIATYCVVAWDQLPGQQVAPWEALLNLTMLQGLFHARHVDGAYWSLQAELLFYGAMLALHQCGALKRPALAIGGWLAAAFVAGWIAADPRGGAAVAIATKVQTMLSLKYIHMFALGMLLYDLRRRPLASGERPRRRWIAAGALAAGCVAFRALFDSWQGACLVAGLATLLAMAVSTRFAWLRRPLVAPPLLFLGNISYSLYLIHQNVGYVVIRRLEAAGWPADLAAASALVMAIGLATLLTRAVEQPTMSAIRNLKKARARPAGERLSGLVRIPTDH